MSDHETIERQAANYLASGLAPSRVWAMLCGIFEDVHSNLIAECVTAAILAR